MMRWIRSIGGIAAALVLFGAHGIGAQTPLPPPPPPGMTTAVTEIGTGAISGVVSDGRTGRPIGGAVVYIGIVARGPIGRVSRRITDRKGRFVFHDLPPSEAYFVNASAFGYLEGGYGRSRPSGRPGRISLPDGHWFDAANISLWRPGAISGTVIDERGEPVIGVPVRALSMVMVAGMPHVAAGPIAVTDDRGRYRIYGLSAGSYRVFVPSVQMTVPSSSVVGTPAAPDAADAGLGTVESAGGSRLVVGRFATPPAAPDLRAVAYPPTFAPGTRVIAEAMAIDLDGSDDRTGIDVQIALVPASRISGMVQGPADAVANLPVRLLAAGMEELGYGCETATTITDTDGRFTFVNVPDGVYTLLASRAVMQFKTGGTDYLSAILDPPGIVTERFTTMAVRAATPGTTVDQRSSGGSPFLGRAPLAVRGRDVTGVSVPLSPDVTLSGRVVLESSQSTPPQMLVVTLEPVGGAGMDSAMVDFRSNPKTPRFSFTGLPPGAYFLRTTSRVVRSIEFNGRDVTDVPIDASAGGEFTDVVITLAAKPAAIAGTVRDDNGAPAATAVVLIFPVESELWTRYGYTPRRIRSVDVTTAAAYRSGDLPAGDYFVIAVDESDANAWQDPKFLQAAQPLATRVSVDWGEAKTQDLRLVRVR